VWIGVYDSNGVLLTKYSRTGAPPNGASSIVRGNFIVS
jgi:hypothetical protein